MRSQVSLEAEGRQRRQSRVVTETLAMMGVQAKEP